MLSRKERIQSIEENPQFSVLIVGAGINGIGTFLDLALQGLDVLMIDRGDYWIIAAEQVRHHPIWSMGGFVTWKMASFV